MSAAPFVRNEIDRLWEAQRDSDVRVSTLLKEIQTDHDVLTMFAVPELHQLGLAQRSFEYHVLSELRALRLREPISFWGRLVWLVTGRHPGSAAIESVIHNPVRYRGAVAEISPLEGLPLNVAPPSGSNSPSSGGPA